MIRLLDIFCPKVVVEDLVTLVAESRKSLIINGRGIFIEKELFNLLKNNEHESLIFMPNEIFKDLQENISNTPHKAFAYSYYYLISWLYRYTKHLSIKGGVKSSKIKQILGYKPDYRTANSITKKNGILDKMGYTETTRDFPTHYEFVDGQLDFTLVTQLDNKDDPIYTYSFSNEKIFRDLVPKNFTIKYPIKAFEREIDEDGNIEWEGTFYEFDNTHCIPFEIFKYCMLNENVGCTGFYLYCYLKYQNDMYQSGYDVSLEKLAVETGMTPRTLDKYLGVLKSYKMITFIHNQEFFAQGLKDKDRKANTYIVNEFELFSDKQVPFQRIRIVKKDEYLNMLKEEEENNLNKWGVPIVDIPLEELPY
jgi:hypothetical protein